MATPPNTSPPPTGTADATPAPMAPRDDAPEGTPGTGPAPCPHCGGSGRVDGQTCPECQGAGTVVTGIGGG